MNSAKFFDKAEKAGIKPFELRHSVSSSIQVTVYMDDLENYTVASDSSLSGRGIFKGRLGSFSSDRADSKIADLMIESIKANAAYGREGNPDFFIASGLKYRKVKAYDEKLASLKPAELIDLAKKVSSLIRKADARISISEVYAEYRYSDSVLLNSNGLRKKAKGNSLVLYASVKIEDKGEVESYGRPVLLQTLTGFDAEAFSKDIAESAAAKLGGEPAPSGKYDVVFSPECVSMLLRPLLEQLSAFTVSQHLSLFEGKLGQKVLSGRLTVKENPWSKTPFASSFDAEGIPTQKKTLIDKGVVSSYLYDLDMAKKDNVVSTGDAELINGNIEPRLGFIEVKPGSKTFDELVGFVKSGIYITELDGIGTGLSRQSGNYSLQASGFMIREGRIAEPISLITVAGNLLTDFGRIIGISRETELRLNGVDAPYIAIRKLAVSGR